MNECLHKNSENIKKTRKKLHMLHEAPEHREAPAPGPSSSGSGTAYRSN